MRPLPNYVAAFRCYAWDDAIAELARRFFAACSAARKVVLVDETAGAIAIPGYEKIAHTDDTSCFALPKEPPDRSLWHNGDYSVYFLRRALPGFDHYLVAESDVAVNVDCDPILAAAAERGIDLLAHRIRKSDAEWFWHANARAAFAEPWRALVFFSVLSGRAIDLLLAARQRLAVKFSSGELSEWPIAESFVPSVLLSVPDMRSGEVGEFASVENLNYRPRIPLHDPRANQPGSIVHPVLGSSRLIKSLLAENNPRDFFERGSVLHEALAGEGFAIVAPPLRAALLRLREHAALQRLEQEMGRRGMLQPEGNPDLAYCKPALTSSVSRHSHFQDAQRDAAGANGASLPDDYGFQTRKQTNPWWMVDLLGEYVIDEIRIVNARTNPDRFRTFAIQSSSDSAAWITRFTKLDLDDVSSDPAAPWTFVFSDPFPARYVRIRLLGHQILHLRRVQLFGRALPPRPDTTAL